MEMLIVYEGERGHTRKAAQAMARAAVAVGAEATVKPIEMAEPNDAVRADALVAGCWVKGNVPFGGAETGRMIDWIERLPAMDGKPAGAFCTYGLFPRLFADAVARTGETLNRIEAGLGAKGVEVVTTHAIHRRSPDDGAAAFVGSVLKNVDG
ncbi:MAG: hypothetical protein OEM94_05715 [Acidimicrobiia bacterium]|nr:hypothetical protein [Acidimicrobiia bacterium]